jgi:hypothetical protein
MGEPKSDCILPEVLAGVFILLGSVVTPVSFLFNYQKEGFSGMCLAWLAFVGAVIGVSIYLACYYLNRLLLNIDHITEQYLVPEMHAFIRTITAAYCGFAFIVPNLLKVVNPSLAMLEGISIVLFVHAMGFVPAILFNVIKKKTFNK